MKPVPPSKQLVSLPLDALVSELLGGHSDVSISIEVAEVLLLVCKNKHTCYVQLPSDENVDLYGNKLLQPRLWAYNHWLVAAERWQRQRVVAQRLSDERAVERYNHSLLHRAIMREWPIPEGAAAIMAHTILRDNDTSKISYLLKNRKLATCIEEVK